MKILFIAPNYLPHIGGVEKHLEKLCNELLKDKHEITILVQKFDNSYKDYEKKDNLEIIRLNEGSNKIIRRFTLFSYMIMNLKKILQYDVIHFHDYDTFFAYGLGVYPILKIFKKRVYVTFHGWEGDVPPKKSIVFKRKIVEKLTNANISIGGFIPKWYGTKANIVSYGGVDRADINGLKEKYILFVGRLAPDTGILDYLKAWKIISQNSTLHFLICGDGLLRKKLEKYVKKHNLKNVKFKGVVENVHVYLKDAKVIFTSGYLGILEAFSYKKSVVAIYDNELKKDYLQMIPNYNHMMWVTDNNVDNIVKAFYEALQDNTKKDAAYEYSIENSWKKVKEDYYRLWKIQ
jgi:glycosyltransferase involved in cell wall biosynthesis